MSLLLLTCGLYSTLLALEEDIWDSLTFYFNLGLDDKKICEHVKDHYDTDIYSFMYVISHCRMKYARMLNARQYTLSVLCHCDVFETSGDLSGHASRNTLSSPLQRM